MSAEAMNSEEVGAHREVSSSKNHDADNIQEDMLQDIYESAIEVRIISCVKLFKLSLTSVGSSLCQKVLVSAAFTEQN